MDKAKRKKKDKNRFGVKFNENKPYHREASEILNNVDNIADWLAQAVCAYHKATSQAEVELAGLMQEIVQSMIQNLATSAMPDIKPVYNSLPKKQQKQGESPAQSPAQKTKMRQSIKDSMNVFT